MEDLDTFLITLYVMVDEMCKQHQLSLPKHRGPAPKLGLSEIITLTILRAMGTLSQRACVLPLCPASSENRFSEASRSQPICTTRTDVRPTDRTHGLSAG